MTMTLKIILFEDNEKEVPQLLPALKKTLGRKGNVEQFVSSDNAEKGMYEDRLSKELTSSKYTGAALIVADRDLSGTGGYMGLSEEIVRRVAYDLGIPECAYARGERERAFLSIAEKSEATIAVSVQDPDVFARQVVSIAEGFSAIAEDVPKVLKASGEKSFGHILAAILGKPEYADKISLYASGDQNRLASVLAAKGKGGEGHRRLSCVLGYWLWDSVLRYPGVVVNEVAASSHLNIYTDAFRNDNLQKLFRKARYGGPFAEAKGAMWWRGVLDDIVEESGCLDGREYAAKKLKKSVRSSECCVDSAKPAGYYCVLSNQPVSLENSRGGLTWLPRGADLARISSTQYDEHFPWLE